MRRNQRLLAGEKQLGTLRRRSPLMISSISAFFGNCRPAGGSAKVKVFAMVALRMVSLSLAAHSTNQPKCAS
jgi:hypothetical protein